MAMPNGVPSIVITLVHGTFAPRAAWTAPASPLRSALAQAMPGETIAFRPFEWRGFLGTPLNNGHRYRLAASHRLATALEAQCAQYPSARHFVIAHSHGGNVALYALRRRSLVERLDGVVCLGTPFIRCEPRPIERALATYADIAWAALGALVLIVLALFGEPAMRWLPGQTVLYEGFGLRVTVLSLFFLALFGAGVPLYARLYRRWLYGLLRWANRRQQNVLERLSLPRPGGPPVFCATAQGDEARRHLWWVSATGDVPYWLWAVIPYTVVFWIAAGALVTWPGYLHDALRDPYQFSKDFAMGHWPADLASWQPQTDWDRWYDQFLTRWQPLWQVMGAVVGAIGIMMAVQVIHLAVMAAMPRILRSNPLGFGQETVLDNMLAVIDVSETPPGFPVETRRYAFEHAGLRHSALYEDERVLADVVAWIAGQ